MFFESSILKWFSYYRQSMILQILYTSVDGEVACEKSEKRDVHKSKSLFRSQLKPHLFYDFFPSLNGQTHSGLGDADFPCKA